MISNELIFVLAKLVGCFRLLNSEIGNDHDVATELEIIDSGFRLLNSEIGNDLKVGKTL